MFRSSSFPLLVSVCVVLAFLAPGAGAQCVDYDTIDPIDFGEPHVSASPDAVGAVAVHEGQMWALTEVYGGIAPVDRSDPTAPVLGSKTMFSDEAKQFAFEGDFAYVSFENWGLPLCGLQIVDVSDPSAPVLRGMIDTVEEGYGLTWGVAVRDSWAYVTLYGTGGDGVAVIDARDPDAPAFVTVLDGMGEVFEVVTSETHLFVSGVGGTWIFDLADPAQPGLVGTHPAGGGLRIVGNRLYVAGLAGLTVVDIADVTSPQTAGQASTLNPGRDVVVDGDLAYVAEGDAGVEVFDVSDPSQPTALASVGVDGNRYANQVEVSAGQVITVEGWLRFLPPHCATTTASPASRRPLSAPRVVPNPFNPTTQVIFDLDEPATVTVEVYDARGRRVRTLAHAARMGPGEVAIPWRGVDDAGRAVASGVYHVRVVAGSEVRRSSMALVR